MGNQNCAQAENSMVSHVDTQAPTFASTSSQTSALLEGSNDAGVVNQTQTLDNTSATTSSSQKPKKGGNQSADSKKALLEKIRMLLEQGHPTKAIAILCKVQPTTVNKYVADLVNLGQLPDCPPSYILLSGGMQIQNIAALNITKNNYVSLTQTDDGGVILKPFNIDEVNCQ